MPQRPDLPQTRTNQQPNGHVGTGPQSSAATALTTGLAADVRDLSSEVKHVAKDVAGEARKAAESKMDAGKDMAAERLGAVASALRHTTEQLRSQDMDISSYVDKAASSVDAVSHYLQTRTLSQLINDAEGFARREPAVFLGGAFFAGLLGGRFLKSATPAPHSASSAFQNPSRTVPRPQLGSSSTMGSASTAGGSNIATASPASPSKSATPTYGTYGGGSSGNQGPGDGR